MSEVNYGNKSLGQHWLYDETALEDMVEAAAIEPEDTVLEIGSGLGTLTAYLVQVAKKVIAVEYDDKLARDLPEEIEADNLEVVSRDILKFDLNDLPENYKIAANIPYYLTSNLLRVLCESSNPFSQAALLVQKEVAERVAAKPGDMSLLSVSVQFYCDVSLGRVVKAELFTPPPKVHSQILILKHRHKSLFEDVDTEKFFRLVKAGFSQRRKTILNSLSGGLKLERDQVSEILTKALLSPTARAQTLSLEDWHSLYKQVSPLLSQ
jgi:16S rRNA (adenine1518-N6/adenine1519-N6)-dimethyltransferase